MHGGARLSHDPLVAKSKTLLFLNPHAFILSVNMDFATSIHLGA
jgi:hypothetical protein